MSSTKNNRKSNATKSNTSKFNIGDRVSAKWSDGEFYAGTIKNKAAKGNNYRVEFDDGELATVKAADLKGLKRGRRSVIEELTPTALKADIAKLIKDLKATDDQDEKKRLRRALRRRGHTGGINAA